MTEDRSERLVSLVRNDDIEDIHEVAVQTRFWYEVLFLIFCVYFGWNIGSWLAASLA